MAARAILSLGGVLAIALLGRTLIAWGQGTYAPVASPIPAVRPAVSSPPEILVEPGILPSVPLLYFLDSLDEWVERNIFSFGIPSLRVRVLLGQFAERTAELQGLERAGQLTPEVLRRLVEREERNLEALNRLVSRGLARGRISAGLVLLFTRTRLAAAEAFEELREEREALRVDLEDEVAPALDRDRSSEVVSRRMAGVDPDDAGDTDAVVNSILREMVEKLSDVEGDLLYARGNVAGVPRDILYLLVEQRIGRVRRALLHAQERTSDARLSGAIIVAEMEVRSAAESSLTTALELEAEGHAFEALPLAREAAALAERLSDGSLAVRPASRLAHQEVERVLQELVEAGVIGLREQTAAGLWAHQAVEEARLQH